MTQSRRCSTPLNPETMNLKDVLTRCASEPALHAKLLNTLSLAGDEAAASQVGR